MKSTKFVVMKSQNGQLRLGLELVAQWMAGNCWVFIHRTGMSKLRYHGISMFKNKTLEHMTSQLVLDYVLYRNPNMYHVQNWFHQILSVHDFQTHIYQTGCWHVAMTQICEDTIGSTVMLEQICQLVRISDHQWPIPCCGC